jgi:hypothetical protein
LKGGILCFGGMIGFSSAAAVAAIEDAIDADGKFF